jgi:hypothetical protein
MEQSGIMEFFCVGFCSLLIYEHMKRTLVLGP